MDAEAFAPRPALDMYACLDGFVISYHGEEVACFPAFLGASTGMKNARWALSELERVLGRREAA